MPKSATELWEDYDPRKEDLDVEVVKEWQADGVVSRYVLFNVGTFKGSVARIAAFYTFPNNGKKNPAFVWSHGGGQRAERSRGVYFAKRGYATLDINWLGRPMEPGIEQNTDWGKVDPTQGPRFYPKALRQHRKRGFEPDAHSLDPVLSPRNCNWFLLAVAGRRAITFLERQPEVDASRVGFSGFSMGGTITSLVAIDDRLKAVVPFVGGTANLHIDFPGIERSSLKFHYSDYLDFYAKTMDPGAYWPMVKCPVLFISTTNDFHAAFDRIYQSMAMLKHDRWRVSTNLHENHRPGPEQWALLNHWFDRHLKGVGQDIPATPTSDMVIQGKTVQLTVTPANAEGRLVETEIYYSYDPNPITRFWMRAPASVNEQTGAWSASLDMHDKLPLYAFALSRYALDKERVLLHGRASTIAINSLLHSVVPEEIDLSALTRLPKTRTTFEDFAHELQDWTKRGTSLSTYLFQNPHLDTRNKALSLTIDPKGKRLSLRLRASSKFLGAGRDLGDFSYATQVQGEGPQNIVIRPDAFKGPADKVMDWALITQFEISLVNRQTGSRIDLGSREGRAILKQIELVGIDKQSQ